MAWPYIIAASLSIGWAVSPDVLVHLGRGIAGNSTLYLAALGSAALLSALAVSLIRHPLLRREGRVSQTGLLIQGIGRLPAMTIILAARLSLVLLIPTGVLVTAGFAFNEIFLYWFPNFGFAFILLVIVALLHLAGERFAASAQPLFVASALVPLVLLCLAGLGGGTSMPVSVDSQLTFALPALAGSLLIFLGFDYIPPRFTADSRVPALGGLFCCLLVFLFWSMLSLQYVGLERLGATTVPHLTAAREILGTPGRLLMGIVIISGSLAAVNAILSLALSALSSLATRGLLPGHPAGAFRRRRFTLLMAVLIGTLMMAGLAGQEILETYIYSSLLLWLILVGLKCFAAGRILYRHNHHRAWQGIALGLLFCGCAVYLAASHADATTLFRFTAIIIAVTSGVSSLWLWKKPVYEITPLTPENRGDSS